MSQICIRHRPNDDLIGEYPCIPPWRKLSSASRADDSLVIHTQEEEKRRLEAKLHRYQKLAQLAQVKQGNSFPSIARLQRHDRGLRQLVSLDRDVILLTSERQRRMT